MAQDILSHLPQVNENFHDNSFLRTSLEKLGKSLPYYKFENRKFEEVQRLKNGLPIGLSCKVFWGNRLEAYINMTCYTEDEENDGLRKLSAHIDPKMSVEEDLLNKILSHPLRKNFLLPTTFG